MRKKAKIVYVHGHGIHPNRKILFPAIGAEFIPADPIISWLHLKNPPYWRKILSLALSSIFFPRRSEWDIIIGDGPQFLPVIMKKMKLLRSNQKIIPYLAGEFLYFMANNYYRKTKLLRKAFLEWDAYLCSGKMAEELAKKILPSERYKDIFTIQNFVRDEKIEQLSDLNPDLSSKKLVFVGNGPDGFRVYYKGLDLMFESYARAKKIIPDLSWTIVGEWSEKVKKELLERYRVDNVTWLGPLENLSEIFRNTALYFHCARGDAYPNTVMEAMVAGLPVLISEWTGTREIIEKVDRNLIVETDPEKIADRIIWFFSLPAQKRKEIGEKSRQTILNGYRKENAIRDLKENFHKLIQHFEMGEIYV